MREAGSTTPRRLLRALGAAVLTWAGLSAALLWAAGRPRSAAGVLHGSDTPPPLPPGQTVHLGAYGDPLVRRAGPTGQGPTVLLVHGWMYPADLSWGVLLPRLATAHDVVTVDLPGHGHGARPSAPFRISDAADGLARLIGTLGCGPVIVVGHSLGGPVAQTLAARHPAVVAGLVLVSSAARFNETAARRSTWRLMGLLQVLLRLTPRRLLERLIATQVSGRRKVTVTRMLGPDTPEGLLERLPWILGEVRRGEPEDLAEAGRELGRYDARSWLARLTLPSAVVVTTKDRLVPPASQDELARLLPAAIRLTVAADHDAIVARPDLLADALDTAIASVQARG